MSTEGLSTTFYEGEASQLVLPLLLGVKGNIFINKDIKIFEREYVFNAIEHSFNFSNLKSNVSLSSRQVHSLFDHTLFHRFHLPQGSPQPLNH